MEKQLSSIIQRLYGTSESIETCSNEQLYEAVLFLTKEYTDEKPMIRGKKKVYYISSEFLIGKLLSNNLINLGIYDELQVLLDKKGRSLAELEEIEPEPSLGNGGLGRLAACFLDSIATLNLPGDGIGLNYHYGLFKQTFKNLKQYPEKNTWITPNSWLTKTEKSYTVSFKDQEVESILYEIDVIGYKGNKNKLRLFDLKSVDPSIVSEGITFDKTQIDKNLTLFLYPDDSDKDGHLLRIYQQYFMVSNGAQLILDEMKANHHDLLHLHEHAIIQINDTHPTMVIPELIRLLVKEGIDMEQAIEIVTKTCAYTNHTILAEALEKWPLEYIEQVVPQLVPIIKALNTRIQEQHTASNVQIIDRDGRVHMAHMAIHYGFSVNGVAAIHTDILKQTELQQFYKLYPDKFNNKTNGITFRRWLLGCNPELTSFLKAYIGDGFLQEATELEKLLAFADDSKALETLQKIKRNNKENLVTYMKTYENISINPDSIFDIQIKRLHEYKRQQMNALYIIHKYLEIKRGIYPATPLTFIFGAKAAPAYTIAQDIIHLLLVLQEIIAKDPHVNQHMQVVMIENYNVSKAEKLIPACDVSEQISLASKEASGTGNMKFMLNGALTLGTSDGANVEIHELVGDDNIYIFGEKSDQVITHYRQGTYNAKALYDSSRVIREALDFIQSDSVFKYGDKKSLTRLYQEILNKDYFMTLLDFEAYIAQKDQMFKDYEDQELWTKKCLVNIAKSGFFSSDRTIAEYNEDIWKLNVDIV